MTFSPQVCIRLWFYAITITTNPISFCSFWSTGWIRALGCAFAGEQKVFLSVHSPSEKQRGQCHNQLNSLMDCKTILLMQSEPRDQPRVVQLSIKRMVRKAWAQKLSVSFKVALLSAGIRRHSFGGWSLHPSEAGELYQWGSGHLCFLSRYGFWTLSSTFPAVKGQNLVLSLKSY